MTIQSYVSPSPEYVNDAFYAPGQVFLADDTSPVPPIRWSLANAAQLTQQVSDANRMGPPSGGAGGFFAAIKAFLLSTVSSVTTTTPASVTLGALSLSSVAFSTGGATSVGITGKTTGSTITATSSDGTALTVSGTTLTGTFTVAGSPAITLVETLAGATGSPKTSTVACTVASGAVSPFAAKSLRTTSDLTTATLAPTAVTAFTASTGTTGVKEVLVDTSTTYQTWIGLGAALTDSSAYVLMTNMTAAQRTAFLTQMFSPTSGLGFNFIRMPMGDSDYTTRNANGPTGTATATGTFSVYDNATTDDSLASFSTAQDNAYIDVIYEQIKAINPNIITIRTPWSPPPFFKTNVSLTSPSKDTTYFNATAANITEYAQYFVKDQQDFYSKHGRYSNYITVQNEPNASPTTYPGCRFNGNDIMALGVAVRSAFNAANISTLILSGDASWGDTTQNAKSLSLYPFQNGAASSFAGAAYHAYDGAPSLMAEMAAYPGKLVMMTEHCALNTAGAAAAAWLAFMGDDLVGSPYYGAQVVAFWNLALDTSGQPGPADNLQAVAGISTSGAVTFSPQYYALAQMASYVKPGAVRVKSTTFGTIGRAGTDVQTVTYVNPDTSRVQILFNSGSASATVSIKDQQAGNYTSTGLTLAAQEVRSVTWKNAALVVAPDAPAIIASALSATTVQIALSGNAPANGGSAITGYDIWTSTASGAEAKVASNQTLPYTITGLMSGNAVYIKAASVNSAGSGILSAEVSVTPSSGIPAHSLVVSQTNSNSYVSPATTANRGTDSYVDAQVYCALQTYAAATSKNMPLAHRWGGTNASASNSSWMFAFNPSGDLGFIYYAGTTFSTAYGTTALTSVITPGSTGIYLRGILNITGGAVTSTLTVSGASSAFVSPSGSMAAFYSTDGTTWYQLGATVTGLSLGTLPVQGLPVVGHTGGSDSIPLGNFFKASVRDSTTLRWNPDFTSLATGTTSFADTAPTPNTWTVNSAASIS